MNVYARPFVSETFSAINKEYGSEIFTAPLRGIDFDRYSSPYLAPRLLPARPPELPRSLGVRAPIGPSQNDYANFFAHFIHEEVDHQAAENFSYWLPCHSGSVQFDVDETGATVTLTVPGLRENTPYVEEDDVVELRQLRFTASGALPLPAMTPQTWTGYIYKARVASVMRARETLVLRVTGLTYQSSDAWFSAPYVQRTGNPTPITPPTYSMQFNVLFPVQPGRYAPMLLALPEIKASLDGASKATYSGQMLQMPVTVGEPLQGQGKKASSNMSANLYWMQSMLFPTEADCDSQNNIDSAYLARYFFDQALNEQQRIAVENICSQNYGVLPYLISGPPGTGKTKTIIETALQLVKNVDNVNHILICAPSEPAADTLADRLRPHLQQSELFRLNRPSRGFGEVASALLPYCHVQNDTFALPEMPRLLKYKVVVTSCRDASMLVAGRMTNADLFAAETGLKYLIHGEDQKPTDVLHWGAVLIDEAAQAMEPEASIPLLVARPPANGPTPTFTPVVVMAGDENQLTPRTSCPVTPLKRSLFARLFSRPVYANHPLSRRLVASTPGEAPPPGSSLTPPVLSPYQLPMLRPPFTNLVQNYRSHPAILAVPSSLFYYDTLEASADPSQTTKLISWPGWPRRARGNVWPILFHDNKSPDEQEVGSLGWYNLAEASLALQYASSIAQTKLTANKEICIMSPFKDQVKRIRNMARSNRYHLGNLNIGPTEAFQGLEFDIVILCVTRSKNRASAQGSKPRQFLEMDQALGWGVIPPSQPRPASSSSASALGAVTGNGNGNGTGLSGVPGQQHHPGQSPPIQGQGISNKLNVALTRARAGLVIIGDIDFLREEDPVCWGTIIEFYERNGCIIRGSTLPSVLTARPASRNANRQVRTNSWADVAKGTSRKDSAPDTNTHERNNSETGKPVLAAQFERQARGSHHQAQQHGGENPTRKLVVRTRLEQQMLADEIQSHRERAAAAASIASAAIIGDRGGAALTLGMLQS
ncbi:P-loop containing nucleoside triphosphate hydrolase protein [Naviculisporaceae sp. PSN 640]